MKFACKRNTQPWTRVWVQQEGLMKQPKGWYTGRTLDFAQKWLRTRLNKQTRNYKNYNSYAAPSPKYEFQIDLMDVSSLLRDVGVEKGNQRKFDMVRIDIFGKKFHLVLTLALFMMPWRSALRSRDSLWWFAAMTKEHWAVGRFKTSSKLRASHVLTEKHTRIKPRGRSGQSKRWLLTDFAQTKTKLGLKWWKCQWKDNNQVHSTIRLVPNRARNIDTAMRFKQGQISY